MWHKIISTPTKYPYYTTYLLLFVWAFWVFFSGMQVVFKYHPSLSLIYGSLETTNTVEPLLNVQMATPWEIVTTLKGIGLLTDVNTTEKASLGL